MILFAKIAMTVSFAYYALTMGFVWIGQLAGWHNQIWNLYDFPTQPGSPPVWTMLVGLAVTLATLGSLGFSYLGVWSILNGGRDQDFRKLAGNLRRIALGLIGFWLGYNLLLGGVQHLITLHLASTEGFDFGWDPLDIDIILAILGIALLAISRTLERAWIAEDENKLFL